jgi:hypothetical protein
MTLPLLAQIIAAGLPHPLDEHEFCPGRRWRFDHCWPDQAVAVEVDGGTWTKGGGRHNRGKGYEKDCSKLNAATLLGWRVLRFTTAMVADGRALATIQQALENQQFPEFRKTGIAMKSRPPRGVHFRSSGRRG